ncbi:MAG: glycosyl hydrolase family 18 protein [Arachidicoccus sp.]|nr:glycosyl hydrolase family 18 protein [Arachidicoccus sp.]
MRNIGKNGILVTILLFFINCNKGEAASFPKKDFRVIGYILTDDITNEKASEFDFSKINYLNIAFLNPDSTGNFVSIPHLPDVIMQAHAKNVQVLASLGGGNAPAFYTQLLSDTMRTVFLGKIVDMLVSNGFDGIDVDLEGERIDSNYTSFIIELSGVLKFRKKLLTASVATAYKDEYSDKALSLFDFVNIMSYDKTGPWNPSNVGQHSPYDMAVSDILYWNKTRDISANKLNLGLPFYGYGFGNGVPPSISFFELVAQYPGADNKDEIKVSNGGIIYYNGSNTIKKKTELAMKDIGGVMIWQLMQDATGNNSLLNIIDNTIAPQK